MLIGRNKEVSELTSLLSSAKSEFVAVYGRRRVGKTFLIREAFKYKFAFQHTGIFEASLPEQLSEFRQSLYAAGMKKCRMPKTWHDAFHLLEELLGNETRKKKVVFIDELPWLDTPKSNFVRALDHFWNGWATMRKDIILVVCGNSTSWIIDKVILNYGGLHNRLTKQIFLHPFTLRECEQLSASMRLGYTRRQLLDAYMILGGVPFYWSLLQRGKSLAQNIDNLFFTDRGELRYEFDALYVSLFRSSEPYINVISSLTKKKSGLTRGEILDETGLDDNSTFLRVLSDLERCGFIRKYTCLGKKTKDAIYQLIDNFTLFYFSFIHNNAVRNKRFWSSQLNSPRIAAWSGLAFERVCLQHIEQIKFALGIPSVVSNEYSWTYRAKSKFEKGVQIDLLIDRNDQVINLCEMKYTNDVYTIDSEEEESLRRRMNTFVKATGTKKSVFLTMITSYGLSQGGWSDDVQCKLTMDDLFSI